MSATILSKKMEAKIRKTGFDENFITASHHHINVLDKFQVEEDLIKRQDLCDVMLSKMFIDKLDMYPVQRFKCQVSENSAWPIPLLPSDIFNGKQPETFRKISFYESLRLGDILDCRVSSDSPTEYKLRVIHKYGVTRILDDLNLTVVLHRNKTELEILKGDLLTCELIRVAVSDVKRDGEATTVFCTVDTNNVVFTVDPPQLGRISEDELPQYVIDLPDTDKYESYSDYLKSMQRFNHPSFMNASLVGFGVDNRAVHSYYPKFNGMGIQSGVLCAETLLRESKLNDAKSLANDALAELERKDYKRCTDLIESALKMCPDKDPLKCRLYEILSDKHAQEKHFLWNAKCLESAYQADKHNKRVRAKLSKVIFKCANRYYQQKNYQRSVILLEKALELDGGNDLATTLLEYTKKSHGETLNFEAKSLLDLHETKMKIMTQLKKFKE